LVAGELPAIPASSSIVDAWAALGAASGLSAQELAKHVAAQLRLDVADPATAQPSALRLIPESVATRYHVFPIREDDRTLVVATADPSDLDAEQAIAFASGRSVQFAIAPPLVVAEAITSRYAPDRAVEELLLGLESGLSGIVRLVEDEDAVAIDAATSSLHSGPVVKLTNMILEDAVRQGASDIHIQPSPTGGVVRFRIDGVLRTAAQLPLPAMVRVVSRIKIIGKLDIADRLRPQDGRVRIAFGERRYDLRISTVPTRSVEKAVIRILDPGRSFDLDVLGVGTRDVTRIRRLLSGREGIVVVTGPTGSGKTTTMYAAIREVATEGINVMTVEDPVEYELPGTAQIQVETKQGVTFASALRAILRQDPDVIFIGEIRDAETAEIAAQAAQTGHLVLATLHTNDAAGSIRRLMDLGLDAATVSQTLRGALAQRLVRRVCPACSVQITATTPLTPDEERLSAEFGVRPLARAVGCDQCGQSGYRGRQVIMQIMTLSPALEALIMRAGSHADIVAAAEATGMRTLRAAGAERVADGTTTLDELERVLGDVDEAAPAAPGAAPAAAASATTAPAAEREERVSALVADDDPSNRIVAKALLESLGLAVREAPNGEVAIDVLGEQEFGLIILDLDMPILGGREVLSTVKSDVTTAGIPVIVLTGTLDQNAEVELLEAGADDYIRKPVDPAKFLTRVKAVLRRARG
jgi:type II secretory ATPase GspE/PulE/Tfp pilus assembly ATPase PilB-like protein/CheY-like chemotaxis protein